MKATLLLQMGHLIEAWSKFGNYLGTILYCLPLKNFQITIVLSQCQNYFDSFDHPLIYSNVNMKIIPNTPQYS